MSGSIYNVWTTVSTGLPAPTPFTANGTYEFAGTLASTAAELLLNLQGPGTPGATVKFQFADGTQIGDTMTLSGAGAKVLTASSVPAKIDVNGRRQLVVSSLTAGATLSAEVDL
jgi:hypothetical protein